MTTKVNITNNKPKPKQVRIADMEPGTWFKAGGSIYVRVPMVMGANGREYDCVRIDPEDCSVTGPYITNFSATCEGVPFKAVDITLTE